MHKSVGDVVQQSAVSCSSPGATRQMPGGWNNTGSVHSDLTTGHDSCRRQWQRNRGGGAGGPWPHFSKVLIFAPHVFASEKYTSCRLHQKHGNTRYMDRATVKKLSVFLLICLLWRVIWRRLPNENLQHKQLALSCIICIIYKSLFIRNTDSNDIAMCTQNPVDASALSCQSMRCNLRC